MPGLVHRRHLPRSAPQPALGLVDAASVPLATTDPTGPLVGLGFGDETVAQLLRLG